MCDVLWPFYWIINFLTFQSSCGCLPEQRTLVQQSSATGDVLLAEGVTTLQFSRALVLHAAQDLTQLLVLLILTHALVHSGDQLSDQD